MTWRSRTATSGQGALSTPESVDGLKTVQTLMEQASGAAKDGNEANPQTPFCTGEVGMLAAPGWVKRLIEDPDAGCPDMMANLGVFALPGTDGEPAPVLLGGSDIAISAKSKNQDLAKNVVGLMLSDDYQKMMAEAGLTPAEDSLVRELGDDEYAAGDDRGGAPTPSSPRPRRAGRRSRALGCSRTCSSTSPTAATSTELAAAADETITEQLG